MRTSTLITADDFARVAPVLGPCELVAGEIIPMSPAGVRHSEITTRVAFLLERHNQTTRSGRVLSGQAGIIVARKPDTVRGADVAYVSDRRLPKQRSSAGFLTFAPELAVEVLGDDTSWKEIEQKIGEYHACGLDVVWIVDPRMMAVRAYPRGGTPVTLQRDAELVAEHPAGFRCRVSDIFD